MSIIGEIHNNCPTKALESKDFKIAKYDDDSIYWQQSRKALNKALSKNIYELLMLATDEKVIEGTQRTAEGGNGNPGSGATAASGGGS